MIDQIIREVRAFVSEHPNLSDRDLAIVAEMQRKYVEYLDKLLTSDLKIRADVTVSAEGQAVKFENTADFSEWLADMIAAKELA